MTPHRIGAAPRQRGKRSSFAQFILHFFVVIITCCTLSTATLAAKPRTIPALQEWNDGNGSFSYLANGRIVVNTAQAAQLNGTAQVLRDDLFDLAGHTHTIVSGTSNSLQAGDVFLTLDATDTALGSEGYQLTISDRIVISARADNGAFYGTRTLLQLLKQNTTIAAGTARDFPRYPLRALHVDSGRKFVTVKWLKDHIKELAYLKMNLFHWHLSDWNNFRLESSTHPEIVAAEHYTKAEVQDMLALAAKYRVIIMPEFEMPGHMGWALWKHPELRVVDRNGQVHNDILDLSNPASYTFVSDMLHEWVPLFPGPYFHLGTDESIVDYSLYPQYLAYAQTHFGPTANAKDVYFNFINWANDIVRSYGKATWAWDDSKTGGSLFSLNRNIILDSWTFAAQRELSEGYRLINCAQASLYFVWYTDWEPMQTQLYETWAPHQWTYGNPGPLQPYTPGLLGAKLALWFDNNQTEEYSMAWGMMNSMRTVAQHTWASPKLAAQYSDFKTISNQLGRAPGTQFPSTLPPIVRPNGPYSSAFGNSIAFSSAGTTARNGSIVKYKWDFGDGGTSAAANPVYTYRREGSFKALLIATDSNGMTAGNQAQVNVGSAPPPVTVNISPAAATMAPSATQTFSATVTGDSNTAVTWSATGGNITSAGFYTAPANTGNYKVRATSVATPTQWAEAAITVVSNPPPGGNLALNKPATASTFFSASYAPTKANDNDASGTRWCAVNGNNGQWLQIDLGASASLSGSEVKWESNGVWRYKIETSNDAITWTLAVDRSSNNAAAQIYSDTFSASGRYVRITATTNQPGHWASIFDFKVFGQ